MPKAKVVVIVGPTASGKSALAVRLAKRLGGEIISADSRQVYRGLDIGTDKITKREMGGVPHHLLDVANPKRQFSAAQYKLLATDSLQYIVANSKLPIVVGGAGFYIDVLTKAVTLPDVAPNKTLRKRLGKMSVGKLFEMLKKKDSSRAKTIDHNNKMRLVRALEIIDSLGHIPMLTPSVDMGQEFIFIGLKLEREELEKTILARLERQIPATIRECRRLHRQGLTWKRMHELGLEYRCIAMYLQNKISKREMAAKLYIEIKHYSKRQITWFKRNKKIKWFKPEEYERIERYVRMTLLGD